MEMLCEESRGSPHEKSFREILDGNVGKDGANNFLQLVTVPVTDQYDNLPGQALTGAEQV